MRHRYVVSSVTAVMLACALAVSSGAPVVAQGIAPEWGSRGGPLADCGATAQLLDNLKSHLPMQEEQIRKAEARLQEAEASRAEATEEMKTAALSAASSTVTDILKNTRVLKARINALKNLSKEDRAKWLQKFKTIEDLNDDINGQIEEMQRSSKAFAEGQALGEKIRQQSVDLQAAAKFFEETGLNDDAAKLVAESTAGWAGVAAVNAAIAARDLGLATYKGFITSRDAETFRRDLENLKNSQSVIKDKISSHEEVINTVCNQTAPVRTTDSTQLTKAPASAPAPQPAATPAPANAPEPTPAAPQAAAQSGGGGSAKGAIILVGAAVGGGAIAGTALKKAQESSSSGSGSSSSGGSSGGGGSTTTTVTSSSVTCTRSEANNLYTCTGTLTARVGPSVSAGSQVVAATVPSSIRGTATAPGGAGQLMTFTILTSPVGACQASQTNVNFLVGGSPVATSANGLTVTCR